MALGWPAAVGSGGWLAVRFWASGLVLRKMSSDKWGNTSVGGSDYLAGSSDTRLPDPR